MLMMTELYGEVMTLRLQVGIEECQSNVLDSLDVSTTNVLDG